MSEHIAEPAATQRPHLATVLRGHWKFFLAQGIFMMALGLLAVALPHMTTLTVEIFVGWLLFAGGIFRFLTVLRGRRLPGFWWSLLTALVAISLGLLFILEPRHGVLTLTLALALIFALEGIAAILTALDFRRHLRHWGWTLFSGIASLALACIIWFSWPGSAAWIVGLLVGINMFLFGLALAMTAIGARAVQPE